MVAFTWSIANVLTTFAFFTGIALIIQIHSHYRRMERYYESDDWISQFYTNDDDGNDGGEGQGAGSHDQQEEYEEQQKALLLLSTMSARSMTFVAVYTMLLATALSLYGSTAIVGFTSLRGVYIAPCFSSGSDKMRVGIFGGAIVVFANLLLVCAVILGEVRVEDYRRDREGGDRDEKEPYQVERIATVLAVACMFLSALYTIFAVLLFLCYASDDVMGDDVQSDVANSHAKTPLVSVTGAVSTDQRQLDSPGFITMENSSQGTSA